jgi:methylated-DNA-[protein]-cysteine S-methyltransferase
MTYYTVVDSPIDPITLLTDGTHLTGLYMAGADGVPELNPEWVEGSDVPVLQQAREQLTAYFDGDLECFDLPLAAAGTDFQLRVWAALRDIPYGETISYGTLASRIGNSNASRAVGLANGKNPISIIVPCHRVIGSSGKLVGFGGGLNRKSWLLNHELKHARCKEQVTLDI